MEVLDIVDSEQEPSTPPGPQPLQSRVFEKVRRVEEVRGFLCTYVACMLVLAPARDCGRAWCVGVLGAWCACPPAVFVPIAVLRLAAT